MTPSPGLRAALAVCAVLVFLLASSHCATVSQDRKIERVRLQNADGVVVKRALVIGNGAYTHVNPLPNPVNDARALSLALERLNFKTTTVLDANREQMTNAIETFVSSLGAQDTALISYSGHGVEVDRTSILLPIDVQPDSPSAARKGGVPLSSLLGAMSTRHGGVSLLIIDACRENPFEGFDTKGFDAPLDPEFSRNKSAIWFATSPSYVADDGLEGAHSPFMDGLLAELAEAPDRPLANLAAGVQRRVRDSTGQRQKPWLLDFTEDSFAFGALPAAAGAAGSAREVRASEGHALLIGISHYSEAQLRLQGAAHDAERMSEWLGKGRAYDAVSRWDVKLLKDELATAASLRAGLADLTERSHVGDRVVLFFAGHSTSIPDDGADEPDGKDEVLVATDAKPCLMMRSSPCEIESSGLRDDELVRWIRTTQEKVGPRGHVLVVTDAHPMFDDRTLLAARAPNQAPLVLIENAGPGEERADDRGRFGGVLTMAIGNELVGASKGESWRDMLERIESTRPLVSQPLAHAMGDLDQWMLGNEWAPSADSATPDPTRSYGPRSMFVRAGRLSGWFPGTQITFVERSDGAASGWPVVGQGIVAQTGPTRARVEVTSGDMDRVRMAFARPERRAMPPEIKVRVELGASVKTRRAELQKMIEDLGLAGSDSSAYRMIVQEQTNYFVVTDGSGRSVSQPIVIADLHAEEELARSFWKVAFGRYLQQSATPDAGRVNVTLHGSVGCGDGRTEVLMSTTSRRGPGTKTRGLHLVREAAWILGLRIDEPGALRTMGHPRLGDMSDCLVTETSSGRLALFIASEEHLEAFRHLDALATSVFSVTRSLPEEVPLGRTDAKTAGLDDGTVELGAVWARASEADWAPNHPR